MAFRLPPALAENLSELILGQVHVAGTQQPGSLEQSTALSQDTLLCGSAADFAQKCPPPTYHGIGCGAVKASTPTITSAGGYVDNLSVCPAVDLEAAAHIDNAYNAVHAGEPGFRPRQPLRHYLLEDSGPVTCADWEDDVARKTILGRYAGDNCYQAYDPTGTRTCTWTTTPAGKPVEDCGVPGPATWCAVLPSALRVEGDVEDLHLWVRAPSTGGVADVDVALHVEGNVLSAFVPTGGDTGSSTDPRPCGELALSLDLGRDITTFAMTPSSFDIGPATLSRDQVRKALEAKLVPDQLIPSHILLSFSGDFCPTGPLTVTPAIISKSGATLLEDGFLSLPGCPEGAALDGYAPPPYAYCPGGWKDTPDGANTVRAYMRAIPGTIGGQVAHAVAHIEVGGKALCSHTPAGSLVCGDRAVSEGDLEPVSGEVPYLKSADQKSWPLGTDANRTVTVSARPIVGRAFRTTGARGSTVTCAAQAGSVYYLLDTGLPLAPGGTGGRGRGRGASSATIHVDYPADTLPEDDPVAPWVAYVDPGFPTATATVSGGVLHVHATPSGSLTYYREEPVSGLVSRFHLSFRERLTSFDSVCGSSPGLCIQIPISAAALAQDKFIELFEDWYGDVYFNGPIEGDPSVHRVAQIDPTVFHTFTVDAVRDGTVTVGVDGTPVTQIAWADLIDTPADLSPLPPLAGNVAAAFATEDVDADWDDVSYDLTVPQPPPGQSAPTFTATPLFGNGTTVSTTAGLAGIVGSGPVLVSAQRPTRRRGFRGGQAAATTSATMVIRPPDLASTVTVNVSGRVARMLPAICSGGAIPSTLANQPPVVIIASYEADFRDESIDLLRGQGRLHVGEQNDAGTVIQVLVPGPSFAHAVELTLDDPSTARTTSVDVFKLGWLRFDGESRIASGVDDNWTTDTSFGLHWPNGAPIPPSLLYHLDTDGSWLLYTGPRAWPQEDPRNMVMGTADLPTVELNFDFPYPPAGTGALSELPLADSWQVDTAGHTAYGAYSSSGGDPKALYRAWVGVSDDPVALATAAGAPFAYTFTPAGGSGCYADDLRRHLQVSQVKLDRLEVHVPDSGNGQTYQVDAGELLLSRPGPVGIPYLTNGGPLPVGTTSVSSSVQDLIDKGQTAP